jgi:hypothetical protein
MTWEEWRERNHARRTSHELQLERSSNAGGMATRKEQQHTKNNIAKK